MSAELESGRVAALRDRRADLDLAQKEVAKELATSDAFSVSERTISGYLSKWETGKSTPSDDELDAYEAALDAIEAEQNREEPDCSNPECNTDSDYPRVETDDGPLCQVCYYTREVEPLGGGQ